MRRSAVFFDAFLDGFTMAGFVNRLRQPGAATHLFAPSSMSSVPGWAAVSSESGLAPAGEILSADTLRSVPDATLHRIMELVKREEEARRASPKLPNKPEYGATH
jgi:hypothetical protein